MGQIKFTVGMAVFDGHPQPGQPHVFFESVRAKFTAMSALIHHPLVDEVIFVDNNPHPDNPLRHLAPKAGGDIKYIEMREPQGTAPPRNRVFVEARNEHVVVFDPHVFMYPGSFEAVMEFYAKYGWDCPDVLHGCMMTEKRGHMMATHMNDVWRAGMLGTWAVAWIKGNPRHQFNSANSCILCGKAVAGQHHAGEWCPKAEYTIFSTHTPDDKTLTYHTMPQDGSEQRLMNPNEIKELGLPYGIGWGGHEVKLVEAGCSVPTEPFQVPGHGMGWFACRRDSWLPFHKDCRGFGGEEITTGKRFRQAGRRAWCVPGVKWWHDFERPRGHVPYNLSNWNKVRNYLLEFNALGLDIIPIKQHFWGLVPTNEWAQLESGVEWPAEPAPGVHGHSATPQESLEKSIRANGNVPANIADIQKGHSSLEDNMARAISKGSKCGQKTQPTDVTDQLYNAMVQSPSPVQLELPRLRTLAAVAAHGKPADVVEIAHQSSTAAAFLAAAPRSIISYGQPVSSRTDSYSRIAPAGTTYQPINGMPNGPIPECDLLFLDVDPHTSDYYYELLHRHSSQVRRLIAIHDTVVYGELWNNVPGLLDGIGRFLKDTSGQWQEMVEWKDQNGLMVLGRDPNDVVVLKGQISDYYAKNRDRLFPPVGQPAGVGDNPPKNNFPADGVGARLKEILKSVGVEPGEHCDCNYRALQMNQFGPDECEQRIDEISGWLSEGSDRWSWTEKVKIAARAVKSGLAFHLDPIHPYKSLVREAIKRERARLAELESNKKENGDA